MRMLRLRTGDRQGRAAGRGFRWAESRANEGPWAGWLAPRLGAPGSGTTIARPTVMKPGPRGALAGLLATLVGVSACDVGTTVLPAPELAILTQALEPGAVGQLYAEGIDAEGGGGGYYWEFVSGALPPGLAIQVEDRSDDDVLLAGVPERAGAFTFTLRVTSEERVAADSAEFTVQIAPAPNELRIANVALPPTVVGGQVAIPLRVARGRTEEPRWMVAAGALPAGLVVEPDGRISGAARTVGSARVVLGVTVGAESTFKAFDMRVFPNDASGFGLTLFPLTEISAELLPHVEMAAERWEQVITADLGGGMVPESFFEPGQCGGLGEEANGTAVDDMLVLIYVDSIDGPGRVLGQAGPCGIRGDLLPFVSVLMLDESDLLPLAGTVTLTSLVTHELGHALGFGALWRMATLLQGDGTDDPRFTGTGAVTAWRALGGEGSVPVENEGGEGTADSHLRERVFDRELMTGFAEPTGVLQPMSRVTIAAMADLGYAVDLDAADPFTLDRPSTAEGARVLAGWDVVLGPERMLPDFGRPASADAPR